VVSLTPNATEKKWELRDRKSWGGNISERERERERTLNVDI
jgi:hypothetical protein